MSSKVASQPLVQAAAHQPVVKPTLPNTSSRISDSTFTQSPSSTLLASNGPGVRISPSTGSTSTFPSRRKAVPESSSQNAIVSHSTTLGDMTATTEFDPTVAEARLEQQLRTSAYVNSFTQYTRIGNGGGSPGRSTPGAIQSPPTPPPRTSSAHGLGIDVLAPVDLAPPITGPLTGVPNSRIHYLRAARQSPKNIGTGSQTSGSESGSPLASPVSESFSGSTPSASPRIKNSPSERTTTPSSTPSIDVHLSEKRPVQDRAIPPTSSAHPLNQLRDSELNKTLPSLPPPSIYDPGRPPHNPDEFTVDVVPEPMKLWEASQCYVTDELGRPRKFGEFWDRTDIKLDPDMYAKRASVEKAYRKKEAKELRRSGGSSNGGGRSDAGSIRSVASSTSVRTLSTNGIDPPSRSGTPIGSRPGTPNSRTNSNPGRRDSGATIKATSSRKTEEPVAEIKCGGEEHNAPGRKTVIFWIRHFWCGQCQDYTFASLSTLDPEAINAAGINVIVISNGSWKIIRRYRELFKCPYPIYVDGSRKLYQLMGMTKLNNDFGPSTDRASYHRANIPVQFARGVGNALFKMPLADPGKLTQLGGEFVLGPGLQCSFAHRMTNTSNHMEAYDVMTEAGCESCTVPSRAARALAAEETQALAELQREEAEWREGRTDELRRMRESKAERRGAPHYAESVLTDTGTDPRRLSSITEPEDGEGSRKGSVATIPGVPHVVEESEEELEPQGEATATPRLGTDVPARQDAPSPADANVDTERRVSDFSDVSGGYGEHAFAPDRAAFIAEYSKAVRGGAAPNRGNSHQLLREAYVYSDDRSMSGRSDRTTSTDAFELERDGELERDSIAAPHAATDDGRSSYAGDYDDALSAGRLSRLTLDSASIQPGGVDRSERNSSAGFGAGGMSKLSAFLPEDGMNGGKTIKV